MAQYSSFAYDDPQIGEDDADSDDSFYEASAIPSNPQNAIKCIFYKNGDTVTTGSEILVSKKRYPTMDRLLEHLAATVRNGGPVRRVVTPSGHRSVEAVTDLKDGMHYVVMGPGESFKAVSYGSASTLLKRKSTLSKQPGYEGYKEVLLAFNPPGVKGDMDDEDEVAPPKMTLTKKASTLKKKTMTAGKKKGGGKSKGTSKKKKTKRSKKGSSAAAAAAAAAATQAQADAEEYELRALEDPFTSRRPNHLNTVDVYHPRTAIVYLNDDVTHGGVRVMLTSTSAPTFEQALATMGQALGAPVAALYTVSPPGHRVVTLEQLLVHSGGPNEAQYLALADETQLPQYGRDFPIPTTSQLSPRRPHVAKRTAVPQQHGLQPPMFNVPVDGSRMRYAPVVMPIMMADDSTKTTTTTATGAASLPLLDMNSFTRGGGLMAGAAMGVAASPASSFTTDVPRGSNHHAWRTHSSDLAPLHMVMPITTNHTPRSYQASPAPVGTTPSGGLPHVQGPTESLPSLSGQPVTRTVSGDIDDSGVFAGGGEGETVERVVNSAIRSARARYLERDRQSRQTQQKVEERRGSLADAVIAKADGVDDTIHREKREQSARFRDQYTTRKQFYSTESKATVTAAGSSGGVVRDYYRIGPVIGEGNFAQVRMCTRRATNERFALKIIDKEKLKGKEQLLDNELALLSRVSHHPNIVALIESFSTKRHLYLVSELVSGGDLFDVLLNAQPLTEFFVASLVKDLACAVRYLHDLGIVHRDLKPENLLFHTDDIGETALKVSDFGLAKKLTTPQARMDTICGTPKYVAPEVLNSGRSECGYGKKVDCWAIGVITYVALSGTPPFASRSQSVLFDAIRRCDYAFPVEQWHDVSDAAQEFIRSLLTTDEDARLSADEIYQHPWVNGATCPDTGDMQNKISRNLRLHYKLAGRDELKTGAKEMHREGVSPQRPVLRGEGASGGPSATVSTSTVTGGLGRRTSLGPRGIRQSAGADTVSIGTFPDALSMSMPLGMIRKPSLESMDGSADDDAFSADLRTDLSKPSHIPLSHSTY